MTYALLDDGFPFHPKVGPLSDGAFRLHVSAICWAKRFRTGGVIRPGIPARLYPRRVGSLVAELVDAGLWEPDGNQYRIHDWEDWLNETDEEAAAARAKLDERRRALSAKRSEAGKAGGKRSAASRHDKFGSAQPKQVASKQTKQLLASSEAPSGARASDPDPDPDINPTENKLPRDLTALPAKQTPRSKSSGNRFQKPTNYAEAILLPLAERAAFCVADPCTGDFTEPQRWPEVREVAATLAQALGQPAAIGTWARDRGVKAVVELFAAGFTLDQVLTACRAAKGDKWWQQERRGLSSLTVEVVRRSLGRSPQAAAGADVMSHADELAIARAMNDGE